MSLYKKVSFVVVMFVTFFCLVWFYVTTALYLMSYIHLYLHTECSIKANEKIRNKKRQNVGIRCTRCTTTWWNTNNNKCPSHKRIPQNQVNEQTVAKCTSYWCRIFVWFSTPKIIKIGWFLTELFKKLKGGRFWHTVYNSHIGAHNFIHDAVNVNSTFAYIRYVQ